MKHFAVSLMSALLLATATFLGACDRSGSFETSTVLQLAPLLHVRSNGLNPDQRKARRAEILASFQEMEGFFRSHTFFGRTHAFEGQFGGSLQSGILLSWLRERITRLEYDETALPHWDEVVVAPGHLTGAPTRQALPSGVIARNLTEVTRPGQHPVLLGRGFLEHRYGAIGRLGTLIHEARHSDDWDSRNPDNSGHPHVKCPEDFAVKPLRGSMACDAPNDPGSYYVEGLFWRELVITCTNCNPGEIQLFLIGLEGARMRVQDPELRARLVSQIGEHTRNL
jgi:hypothetical protein